ncbi:MAG: zf-HC2 domain-containing protein, partial [Planctomycetota bacterium]
MTDCDRTWKELALVFDLLEGEEKRRFGEHLASCPTCRSTIERLRKIEGRVREVRGALHGTHPAPQEIYDYAAGPGAEPIESAERSGALEIHFRRCRECSREVERIRALDRTASPIREVLRGEPLVPDAPPAPI